MDNLRRTLIVIDSFNLLSDEQKKDLIEGYLVPEAVRNNFIELANIINEMLEEQLDNVKESDK